MVASFKKKNTNGKYTEISLPPFRLGKIQNVGNTWMARLRGNRYLHPQEDK